MQDSIKDAAPEIQRTAGNRYAGLGISHREWLDLDNKRRIARLAFDDFFEDVDIILAPVCASAAFTKNEEGARYTRYIEINGKPQLEVMQLFWSGYSGVVGLPSTVGPMDQVGGLPVGYQAISGHGKDYTALAFFRMCRARDCGLYTAAIGEWCVASLNPNGHKRSCGHFQKAQPRGCCYKPAPPASA